MRLAGLYEWTAGKLTFVGAGSRVGVAGLGEPTDYRHAISNAGTRVFWTAAGGSGPHLYVRDTATGEGLQLDVPEAECVTKGKCTGNVGPEFQDASSEGERVFFTDTQQLTVDSGASKEKPDLYECKIEESAGKPTCDSTDLTPVNGDRTCGRAGCPSWCERRRFVCVFRR